MAETQTGNRNVMDTIYDTSKQVRLLLPKVQDDLIADVLRLIFLWCFLTSIAVLCHLIAKASPSYSRAQIMDLEQPSTDTVFPGWAHRQTTSLTELSFEYNLFFFLKRKNSLSNSFWVQVSTIMLSYLAVHKNSAVNISPWLCTARQHFPYFSFVFMPQVWHFKGAGKGL